MKAGLPGIDGVGGPSSHAGFDTAMNYSLLSAIFHRRSRRIMKGVKSVPAGSLSYTSTQDVQPLTALEEAMLIAATGATGITMPDRPFQTETGEPIMGSPNLKMAGRAAGSPDNAQATHFFLINDSGTFYLKHLEPPGVTFELTPQTLLERAEACKQRILDERLEFPREFPFYLDSNRFVSNLPGTSILVPVVDTTRQYINGLMYVLTQEDGHRPALVDDRNFYLSAGVRKWIRSGFLNKDIKVPLSVTRMFRSDIEADLLVQNVVLTLQAMGLGGWIHASISPPMLLGHPDWQRHGPGLGFRFEKPRFRVMDVVRWGTLLPMVRDRTRLNPVGIDGILEGMCPPYYSSMSDAVDALMKLKYGPAGTYTDPSAFRKIFKDGLAERYLKEVPHYEQAAIDCTKDVCEYIYRTHGRFPAHVDAMHVPGIWVQAHHLDLDYYDSIFRGGYSQSHRHHQALWHESSTDGADA